MIKSDVKLNESSTVVTFLPSVFPCRLEYLLSRNVLRAIAVMSVILADSASLCAAFPAQCSLAADFVCSDK